MEKEVVYCESCGSATSHPSGICADCRDAGQDEKSEQEVQSRNEAG